MVADDQRQSLLVQQLPAEIRREIYRQLVPRNEPIHILLVPDIAQPYKKHRPRGFPCLHQSDTVFLGRNWHTMTEREYLRVCGRTHAVGHLGCVMRCECGAPSPGEARLPLLRERGWVALLQTCQVL